MLLESFKSFVRENVPLAPYTWLHLGGCARYFAEPADFEQLQGLVAEASRQSIGVRILGGGSNILVKDSGFDGLVIQLIAPAFQKISFQGNRVTCGGGVRLSHLVTACVAQGLAGVAHLVGIPGSVGGALRANSGTEEGDIGHAVREAQMLRRNGELVSVTGKQLAFSHRRSSLDELAILEATLELQPGDVKYLTKREQTFWIVKRSRQPNHPTRSAVAFIDPDGESAGELIHRTGFSGLIEGSVQMNATYPNYITAGTGATADQVLTLLERVRKGVLEKTGVRLQPHLVVW
ncbi:MAG: FAD-binding protein [Planctomycetes bacterium]|nr:FAD-binding protein [Planctomycetota bacterium]